MKTACENTKTTPTALNTPVKVTVFLLSLFWSIFCGYLYLHSNKVIYNAEVKTALKIAEDNIDKDFLYRRWSSIHGGVYAPISEFNPPNPYLEGIVQERDIQTPSGKKLTLINPAYMVRQVHEIGATQYSLKAHITSLKPLRPLNAPDPWERAALESFTKDTSITASHALIDSVMYFRVMKPLVTEESCLKCHGHQGYTVGEIRGGLSVSVPWSAHEETIKIFEKEHLFQYGGVWFLGMIGLLVAYKIIRKSIQTNIYTNRILSESQKKYYDLVQNTPDLITIIDTKGTISFVNHASSTIWGVSSEECIGKNIFDFIHQDDLKLTQEAFATWLNSENDRYRIENRQKGIHNHEHLMTWSVITERDHNNAITSFVCTARDITDYNNITMQLRQHEKMQAIGQLAGGIAHDFNNQLGGILNFAELVKKDLNTESKAYSYIKNIITGVMHSAELTKQLLAFARKGKYVLKTVDINEIITEVVTILSHSIDKKITISQNLSAIPMTTTGEISQIQNAILNIALNARDAMPSGGELTISTQLRSLENSYIQDNNLPIQSGEYVQVTIKDTGIGMSQETQNHMFEPFYTTKEQGKGTGMGMASAYGTISNHNGAIRVESELDKGTTMILFFPYTESTNTTSTTETKPIVQSGKTIFIIDDEELLASSIQMLLEDEGYQTTVACSSKEAIDIYNKSWQHIDLVLLDMIMPEMNGEETLKVLEEINPNIAVILLSGYSVREGAQKILKSGVKGFLQKPVSPEDLFNKISEVLG